VYAIKNTYRNWEFALVALAAPEQKDRLGRVRSEGVLDDLSEGLSEGRESQFEGAELLGSVEEGEQRVDGDASGGFSLLGAEFELLGGGSVKRELAVGGVERGVVLAGGAVADEDGVDVSDALFAEVLLQLGRQLRNQLLEGLFVVGGLLDQQDDVSLAVRALNHGGTTNFCVLVAKSAVA